MAEQLDETKPTTRRRGLKVALGIVVAVLAAVVVAFWVYVSDYYLADDTAMAAMTSDAAIQVKTLSDGDVVFSPDDPKAGIVFYPGGKVQPEAYAPLLRDLAEEGFLCVLVPMPFNLAVFNVNGADGIQAQFPAIDEWILMGHSLGGAMAAAYADGHDGEWDGLVLLGSYSTSDLSDNAIETLTIYGSEDSVMNRESYANDAPNLGPDAREYVLDGGNHAQFGSYGDQAGDGDATLTPEEQQEQTAALVANAFL